MGRVQRGRVVRVLVGSGLAGEEAVASAGGRVALRGHPRVDCLVGAGRVNPMQIGPPRRFP